MAPRNSTPQAESQPALGFSDSPRAYWLHSSRPLASLLFIVPMLLAYEGGLLVLGPQAMRNGADAWLRRFLETLGFSQYFLLPLVTCALLLAWHHLRHEPWWLPQTIWRGMVLESVGLGFVLLLVAQLHHAAFASLPEHWLSTNHFPDTGSWRCSVNSEFRLQDIALVLSYFGAGVYEELLFRLILLPSCAWLVFKAGAAARPSWIAAVILSSLLFSAVHYEFVWTLGSVTIWSNRGDIFELGSFVFRFLAGAFFGVLFLRRGFGIAAGSHAVYDIFASML